MIWVVLYKIFIRFIVFLALTRSLDEHHYIIPSYDCSISNWFVFHPSDHTEFFWIQSSYRSSHVFNSTSSDILQYLNIPLSTFSARQSAATKPSEVHHSPQAERMTQYLPVEDIHLLLVSSE